MDVLVTVSSTSRRLVFLFVWFLCVASLVVVCLETVSINPPRPSTVSKPSTKEGPLFDL